MVPDDAAQPMCYINGKRVELPVGRAEATLLQYLREIGLTGTKLGCGEGGCGACTVMVSNMEGGKLLHRSVNACLCPLYAVEGMHVVTVEGIGKARSGLHPVQERLAKAHGSQCGFCTPGFVMSMYSLLRSKPEPPTEEEIEENLAGNLCRCTGYRPILDAFKVFAKVEPGAYTEEAIAASRAGQQTRRPQLTGAPNDGSSGSNSLANGVHSGGADAEDPALATTDEVSSVFNGMDGLTGAAPPVANRDGRLSNGTASIGNNGHTKNGNTNGHGTNGGADGAATGVTSGKTNGAANGHTNGASKPLSQTGPICPSTGRPCNCGAGDTVVTDSDTKLHAGGGAKWSRPSSEPIFPPELRKRTPPELVLEGPLAAWYRPVTLASLLALKRKFPDAKLVVGNTEVGIEMKFKDARYPVLIGVTHVPELNAMQVTQDGLLLGASVTLSALMAQLRSLIAERPPHQTSTFAAMLEQLRWFAGNQIRNTASVGGNIVTGSPISDLNPIYMAAGATFTALGEGTQPRQVPAEKFFLGYRRVDLRPHEVLYQVLVPFTRQHEYVKEYKQAHRRDDDIAIVNAGMRLRLGQDTQGGWVVEEASIAYGGVAPKTIMAPKVKAALEGQPLAEATFKSALAAVQEDVNITPNAPGGMVEFRRSLASSFLFRFFIHAALKLEADAGGAFSSAFPPSYASAARTFERPAVHGLQYFSGADPHEVVGQPYRHMAADLQVSGEAVYVDDMPLPANTLHAAFVLSTRPHARLLSVDGSEAVAAEGVAGFYTAADVPGGNDIGAVIHDEECFATEKVTCVGQPIGVVVADTDALARRAARLVKVEYEDLPPLISTDDARQANSYFDGWGHRIDCGDVEAALAECDQVLEGELKIGGQEHFYLECHCCAVVPSENDEMAAYASTQCPNKHQVYMHHVLGVPAHKLVCHTKRIGGGFGGKETRSAFINAAIAVPAYHLNRPVRINLDRDEDMAITGHRHAFAARYKVGFTREGLIKALDLDLYSNAGNSLDLSPSIMDRALLHTDNAYRIPALRAVGHLCKTNIPSNTAYRGFGGPQGMLFTEMWMDRIACAVGRPVEEVRRANFYDEGDTTHYGQVLDGCQTRTCWQNVWETSDYEERRKAADAYNAENRWRKRGLALLPTKFGISFTTKFMNQAGALVHIYTDGTVLVTHGGVEMGQGLHTKVAQVAAQALGVPLSSVYIAETATDKVPNASPTAASASSDMYGAAVADACAQLNARLQPFRDAAKPDATFTDIVVAAHLERVDLSAHGFFATPDITGFGGDKPFNYFTYGAAACEVELDTLSGDFQVLRTDICMDVGKSLNPTIDIGQIEGGFVQGMGWSCIEELVWGDAEHSWVKPGTLFTRGPGTYKIPTANDIPVDFRVTLLKEGHNQRLPQVHSSKAIGEPPFFLGASVFFALKDAVYAARKEVGQTGWFRLDSPATPERLRMACADHLTAPYAAADILPKLSC